MSTWALLVVSALYLYTGFEQGWIKDWNWLGFWACYAGANLFWIRATANAVH
jgi:hypothetical protein